MADKDTKPPEPIDEKHKNQPMDVELVNPGGRKVWVKADRVESLLAEGYRKAK